MNVNHLKTILTSALLMAGMAIAALPAPAMAAFKKPNVLMLLTDDIGMDQLDAVYSTTHNAGFRKGWISHSYNSFEIRSSENGGLL
jgi:hypothetical protein